MNDGAMETWPLRFSFAQITNPLMEAVKETQNTIKEDDSMLMVGIALVLIGVFLIGKGSNS